MMVTSAVCPGANFITVRIASVCGCRETESQKNDSAGCFAGPLPTFVSPHQLRRPRYLLVAVASDMGAPIK